MLAAARYAAALREHVFYVLVVVALAVAAAMTYVALAEDRFEATSQVLVPPLPDDARQAPALGAYEANLVAAAELTKRPVVTARVARRLGVDASALPGSIRLASDEAREVLSITGIGGSPVAAAAISDAYADALVTIWTRELRAQLRTEIEWTSARLDELEAQSTEANTLAPTLDGYRSLLELLRSLSERLPRPEVVSAAIPPTSPVWPRPLATMLVAGLSGLLLGCVVAVALALANPIVIRADAVAEHGGPPLLARLPKLTRAEARQLLLSSEDGSPELREKARRLSGVIGGLLPNWSTPETLFVVGARDGSGAPAIAAALAGRLARLGMRVALIDFDLERAPLARIVHGALSPAASVGQILMARDPRALLDPIRPISESHQLRILVTRDDRHLAGSVSPQRVAALAEYLKTRVDALVISTPASPVGEAWMLLGSADAVIVVVDVGHTRRDDLANLRSALDESNITPFGYVALERPGASARLRKIAARLRRLGAAAGVAPAPTSHPGSSPSPRAAPSPSQPPPP
jgi:Mrp family chromosome partitioning ATPase